MSSLGERIKRARESLGLNQKQFAEKLGLKSATAISRYEKNQREPEASSIIKIAELVNCSTDWLLIGEKAGELVHAAEEEVLYEPVPLYTPEEKEYMKKLVEVLRNPNTKKAIQENIEAFLKVPKPEPPFGDEEKGGMRRS